MYTIYREKNTKAAFSKSQQFFLFKCRVCSNAPASSSISPQLERGPLQSPSLRRNYPLE